MADAFFQLLFLMLAAHALCDGPLQGPVLSAAKRPLALRPPLAGVDPALPWQVALGCHALIHGGAVALVTGIWWLGAAETAAHAAVDAAKCRGRIGMKADQALHAACKIMWAGIALAVAG